MSPPDLAVVDEAYSDFADLYSDVLRVSVVATHEQIQLAYFDRRSELFTLLAKIDAKEQVEETAEQRFQAERKMDAVVLAVRVLGDAEQRLSYDKIRRRAANGQLPGHEPDHRALQALDSMPSAGGDEDLHREKKHAISRKIRRKEREPEPKPEPKPEKKEKRLRKKSSKKDKSPPPEPEPVVEPDLRMDGSKETVDTEHLTEDDDSHRELRSFRTDDEDVRDDITYQTEIASVASGRDEEQGGVLSCITNSRMLRSISDEISGACEDALVSVDQVFNAFTLTDKDIRAVTRRIDKAKKQFDN
jgi:curved DNA-binding protein CbpA